MPWYGVAMASQSAVTSQETIQALPQLGVGLAIVRQLLGLLKCQVNIDSIPGEGCCFHIQLQIT
jgi:signal transduction histidine kinase